MSIVPSILPYIELNEETTTSGKNQSPISKIPEEKFRHNIDLLNDIEKNILTKIYMDGGIILYRDLKTVNCFSK